jgi:ABC-type protease/lipase transport system fused ATPase/permease subunit
MIISAVEASVSINRLSTFLQREELQKDAVYHVKQSGPFSKGEKVISVKGLAVKWDLEKEAVLRDISFSVRSGSLLTVVGPVGNAFILYQFHDLSLF